jgi:hypothetical protein
MAVRKGVLLRERLLSRESRLRRSELRGLDTKLANACLDYLNYDRLGIAEVHKNLANGEQDLHRWLEDYHIESHSRP